MNECYRCGYCGKRTDSKGTALNNDYANSLDVDWDSAVKVTGQCCSTNSGHNGEVDTLFLIGRY